MSAAISEPRLYRRDYFLLAGLCLLLFGCSVVVGRVLSGHESVQVENTREMLADHDWMVPKCGGLPWLERPPLPHWIMAGIATVCGSADSERVARIGPILMAVVVVLLVARLAALWYGRPIGLISGLVLATMFEFFTFAGDPEADMFLCAIVTGALTLFASVELAQANSEGPSDVGFFGSRPWGVLGFFLLFGMTNLAKGLIFGTLMVAVPVAGYLVWNADPRSIRRYVWLWGWLACAAVALVWPVVAYLRYPDVVDLWLSDYVGRLNKGYIGEPFWYYAQALPYVMLPWTLPAVVGLYLTAGRAWRGRSSPERFLWCWGLATPIFFSIPDGKHHHYMLQCLAPWAVMAALGAVKIWESIPSWPGRLRNPVLGLVTFGLTGDVALVVLRHKLAGPSCLLPVLLVVWPLLIYPVCWAVAQRNGRLAFGAVFALLVAVYWGSYAVKSRYGNSYETDMAFLDEVRAIAPAERPLFFNFDAERPLETFHVLFYGDRRIRMLRNLTFLLDNRIHDPEVYVIARRKEGPELTKYGQVETVLESAATRGEAKQDERRALYRLRYFDFLPRPSGNVYITPMQVTSRKGGPYLQ